MPKKTNRKQSKIDQAQVFKLAEQRCGTMGMAEFCRLVKLNQNAVRHALFRQSQLQKRPVPQFVEGSRQLSDKVTVQKSGQIVISKARAPESWNPGDHLEIAILTNGKSGDRLVVTKTK